jgi:hypothetical protein
MGMRIPLTYTGVQSAFNFSNFRPNETIERKLSTSVSSESPWWIYHSLLCGMKCKARLMLTSCRALSSYASRYAISLSRDVTTSTDCKEQISSTLIKSFDKVVEVLAEVGQSLPQFQKYAELFKENHHVKKLLCLFFRDILDFHATVLNFFRKNSRHSIYWYHFTMH